MLWKVEQNRYMKWLYTVSLHLDNSWQNTTTCVPLRILHGKTTSQCSGYSWWNIGWTSSWEIACTKHSLSLASSPPLSPQSATTVPFSLYSLEGFVFTTVDYHALPHHITDISTFPNTMCLSKLAWGITRLGLMTCRNLWLSTRQPYLLSMSFSQSNLAVKIQRAEVLRAQPCG